MRILFVNHTGGRSGAENALLRLLDALPAEHHRAVALPDGEFKSVLRERGLRCYGMPGTDLSFKLHPVHTTRGLAGLAASAAAIFSAARRCGADVIHANGLRAGLICAAVRKLDGVPLVVQSHDHPPHGRSSDATRRIIAGAADAVVGVSHATARVFNEGLAVPKAEHVYISLDHEHFAPDVPPADLRDELDLPATASVVGQVGQITPWKGQDVAIEALALARRNLDVHLVIAGSVSFKSHRFDNHGYHAALRAQADRLGVGDAVHFVGQRGDAPAVLRGLDLLLLPSWDEPFGTVAAESMAVGTPALVTATGGPKEYVHDGVSGLVLPHDQPQAWAEAMSGLLVDEQRRGAMGAKAIEAVARFNDANYCREMLAIYAHVASA